MSVSAPVAHRRPRAWGPALGAAAAAAGLATLVRPGGDAAAACALALLPLGALVFAGAARAAAVTFVLGYVGALVWAYTQHFSPLYAYHGLVDHRPGTAATIVVAGLVAAPATWLPLAARRPSTVVLWFFYLFGYVPMTTIPLFLTGDLGTVLPFDLAMLAGMAIVAFVVRLPPPPIAPPHLSLDGFTRLLAAASIVCSAVIVATFGLHAPPSLSQVYTTRTASDAVYQAVIGIGYLVPWAGYVINPMTMALGLARRRLTLVALGLAGQVLIYSVTGFKSVLFSVVVVPVVYAALARAGRVFGVLAAASGALIVFAVVTLQSVTGGWSIALGTRTLATPGQIGWYYFSYFSHHPTYELSHSFLSGLHPSAYSVGPSILIGSVYFPGAGTNANANLWADAFANFGFAGIFVFTVLFGLVLWVVDGAGYRRDARVAGPVLALAGLTLAESGLFTAVLTNGLALTCVLMALMPPHPAAARAAADTAPG